MPMVDTRDTEKIEKMVKKFIERNERYQRTAAWSKIPQLFKPMTVRVRLPRTPTPRPKVSGNVLRREQRRNADRKRKLRELKRQQHEEEQKLRRLAAVEAAKVRKRQLTVAARRRRATLKFVDEKVRWRP